jgi:hypothetical protein
MSIKEFINKFITLFISFPYEWRKIIREDDNKHLYFLAYSSLLSGISFFLGAMWITSLKIGINFIFVRSLVFSLSIFLYIFIISFISKTITNYYNLRTHGKLAEKLATYTSVYYLTAFIFGALLAPENYFFFVFFLSFFSAYYYYRIINKSTDKQKIAIISGVVLYLFHLTSYFIIINILASVSV